ncbi:MAG: ECF-type sigma factor [Phycisphaerales bacterium]
MTTPLDASRHVTRILDDVNGGREGAFVELVEAVYDDLRRIAHARMDRRGSRPVEALTVQPTQIVNDAIIELRRQRSEWQNREHFFAIATRLIIRLAAQEQRRRLAAKRGKGQRGGDLHEHQAATGGHTPLDLGDADALVETVSALHEHDARQAEVVTLHMVCGHPLPRVAQMVGVSLPTVERDWKLAKVFMHDRLTSGKDRP